MSTLVVFPKKGKSFETEFDTFKLDEKSDRFYLRGSNGSEGSLIASEIAAIMPKDPNHYTRIYNTNNLRKFAVYLKNHLDTPAGITATVYTEQPYYEFFVDAHPIREIYLQPEEVVGIVCEANAVIYYHNSRLLNES